jgi:short subunit dehydrogenase-like uncharacterized protein
VSKIVLFGATGYTGDLTARELVRRGASPLLAGRSAARLDALAAELGGLETQVADVARPESVRALVQPGDVLVTTVGPFARWGGPALDAAVDGGAHYLDSTGEGPFIRRVFELYGPRAHRAGVGLLTAMGYDWLIGNLAGGLALRDAGADARRVELAYFMTGDAGPGGMSGGTRSSSAGVTLEPSYTFRGGRVVTERGARRVRSFEPAPGRRADAISVGSSEQFTLPRLRPELLEVDTYLGWFGSASRPLQALSAVTSAVTKVPGVRTGARGLAARVVKGSTGGPDAQARAKSGSLILARVFDGDGRELSSVRMEGPNGYDLTAGFLAWGAQTALAGGLHGAGALGPVDGFGLDALEAGAAESGLVRV